LSRETTVDDVDHVLSVLPDIIGRLRETSPSWQQHLPATSLRFTELTQ
jgi:cysteine desulfurase